MDPRRRFQLTNVVLFVGALGHALLTWPLEAAGALFAGGMVIAFVAEAIVIRLGLLEHTLTPKLVGVPVTVLLAWPSIVYLFYRVALFAAGDPVSAAAIAAVLATLADVPTDPVGVRDDIWHYPDSWLSNPRFYGVPWWNFVGWLVIVFVTALLPSIVGGISVVGY